MTFDPTQFLKRVQLRWQRQLGVRFFFLVYFFKESLKHIKRIISFQIFLDACICSVPTRAEIRCWVFPYI